MPASSTGALPVSSLNLVRILSPAGVRMTLGAKSFQFWVRSGSPSSVASAARSVPVVASTMPTPVPCTLAEISLPAVAPGPISTTHSLVGSVASIKSWTRAAQSTWLTSTSSASARARSPSRPQACAQATVCSTASAISGEWNGRVTSRYSSTGLNTEPPRTFSSRSLAWCLCSFSASVTNDARSSG